MQILGIVLLVIGGFFAVMTLLQPIAAGELNNGATTMGGLLLSAIPIAFGLVIVL